MWPCKKVWASPANQEKKLDKKEDKKVEKKEEKKEEKKVEKKEEKKPEKKQEKKEEKKVEVEEAPAQKAKNPLDCLPETKFNLYDFKTLIVNAPNKKDAIQFLWDNFDAQG